MTAAWAAYMAQYSSMYSQTGAQANPQAAVGMAYGTAAGQANLIRASTNAAPNSSAPTMIPQMASNSSLSAQAGQPLQPTGADTSQQQTSGDSTNSQDYTDQWIEFYIANGRPDYAEQMIQLKKQQQQQLAQNPQP